MLGAAPAGCGRDVCHQTALPVELQQPGAIRYAAHWIRRIGESCGIESVRTVERGGRAVVGCVGCTIPLPV